VKKFKFAISSADEFLVCRYSARQATAMAQWMVEFIQVQRVPTLLSLQQVREITTFIH